MNNSPIRILQIVPNMQNGGLENLIMNLYRNIDRSKVQFDFLVHYKEKKFFDDEIERLGGKIYRFSLRNDNNLIKYIKELNTFYKSHPEYRVIHCHMSSIGFINFAVAKRNGIKVRIAHSHNSNTDKTIKGCIKKIMMIPYKYVSSRNFACSTEAGKFLYGNKEFNVIPNAIDCNKFKFSIENRNSIREIFNVKSDEILIGHIGRFNVQKNHIFLLKCFKEALSVNNKLKLMLIGDGELKEDILQFISKNNLEDNVVILGVVNDVWKYYSAFDVFVLPSIFEGLPMVGVEAQCSGVKILLADNITDDILITDKVHKLPLDEKTWITQLINTKIESYKFRLKYYDIVLNSDFNIKNVIDYIQKNYIKEYGNDN